ncbi:alpha/beta fold hydrolase [Streptomyces sp. NPDC058872]|uniref:alpha/beta fold hydrolase n=1 Tax=Streptomyces sp. NPDC058872 TaxID=3346661 RepID=UPI003674BC16
MEEPTRHIVNVDGRHLSYLDYGGHGQPLLALHGHFGEARAFAGLARGLSPDWRVIALDQRGHGHSERPADFSRDGYIGDAAAFLDHLGTTDAVVRGHSLGGVNAYQLAARHPNLVRALIIEDIGAEVDDDLSFCPSWPERAPSRTALIEELAGSARYLADAFREHHDGWGLAFQPQDMVASQQQLKGNHWDDWLSSDCPALLIRGTRSDSQHAPRPGHGRPASRHSAR